MYTDDDLTGAVEQGIFAEDQVNAFRLHVQQLSHSPHVDEENFRLISGFNDVFVVIASALLLVSSAWLLGSYEPVLGAISVAVGAWGLSEFFVRRRRMALPAIVLLLGFLGGVFAIPLAWDRPPTEGAFIVAGIITLIAAIAHWRRFHVPITVAAGAAAALAGCTLSLYKAFIFDKEMLLNLMFVGGLLVFLLAMYWDGKDRARETRQSDVAFWLHLLSAPLIVHPIFTNLGILQGSANVMEMGLVLGLYVLMALISIAVDRRAIMVSALVYVIVAFTSLLKTYGVVSVSFAISGVVIGASLLLLSAFWHTSRVKVIGLLPQGVQNHLPLLKTP